MSPILHKTIKKVTDDVDSLKMNTAIAAMMTAVNEMSSNGVTKGDMKILLQLLSPYAPHICEEIWANLGCEGLVANQPWPEYDESKTIAATGTLAVQVGGKMRGNIEVPMDAEQDAVVEIALADPKIAKYTDGMQIVKVILVKNRLVNLILKPKA